MIHQDQDIPVTLHNQSRRIKAIPDGKLWSLDKDLEFYKLCVEDDKLFVMGYHLYTEARTCSDVQRDNRYQGKNSVSAQSTG